MNIKVVSRILEANDRLAEDNRKIFRDSNVYVINLMSAPGAGKTTLLERTVSGLSGKKKIGVIEGDIATDSDAQRIAALGVPVVQINTGGACHLDANMIREALSGLPLKDMELLFIENVGNLVCPAEFDIGENEKVMILSVTEGDDKPLKYPLMFERASALVINKIDLLPFVDASVQKIREDSLRLNPGMRIFEASAKTGSGLQPWFEWLNQKGK
ncbi:MAG: hydrogenase nickel incorporation protein HypB [Thermodesulfovibrionales bacterium]|nr:hydrogenase nickel incorporation protein HypB [Thermodesulfovibrionales bacterium]